MAKRAAPGIEDIAAEVGRLFGTTERHARQWLEQRNSLLNALHLVRTRATDLIGELSGEGRQRRQRTKAIIAKTQIPDGDPSEVTMGRKKRRLSAATRAKMRAAAKRRWAERKKSGE